MTATYRFDRRIDLNGAGRISREDAARQARTTAEILSRLENQPGVILADEVGLGKTFVALAVAYSVFLADPDGRPVVVMVPPSLREKWPRDFALFREKCLPLELSKNLRAAVANRPVPFLKLLDDPPERRNALIFLTHGALSRQLRDPWVKLAIIQRALRKRWDARAMRRILARTVGQLLQMTWVDRRAPGLWADLLDWPPETWLRRMQEHGIDPEHDRNPDTDDDPVPAVIIGALEDLETADLYAALEAIPRRHRKHYYKRIADARSILDKEVRLVFQRCLSKTRYTLPLLILDEAHHLKNARTRLASLFQDEEAVADASEISRGPLNGVFERMLFLTATPFQLGHHELCSVLDRFGSVSWNGPLANEKPAFADRIKILRRQLDVAQECALRLDVAWSRLQIEDLIVNGQPYGNETNWWRAAPNGSELSPTGQNVMIRYRECHAAMREAETLLRPWVIRHLRARTLPNHSGIPRRAPFVGRAIIDDSPDSAAGLTIGPDSLFPFLLAARLTACNPVARPVFAEGLASSYEAFLHTRRQQKERTDEDDENAETPEMNETSAWYWNELENTLAVDDPGQSLSHPKVTATVDRAIRLWRDGEKVLIFCHYIATGRVMRQRVSDEIRRVLCDLGASKLGCHPDHVFENLDRIGERFDKESPARRACDAEVLAILEDYPRLGLYSDQIVAVVRRYVRTPSFLVRYFDLRDERTDTDAVAAAFASCDGSGLPLRVTLDHFFTILQEHCGERERAAYLDALGRIQTGAMVGADVAATYGEDEIQGDRTERLLPNVRLVNGDTKQDNRQRIMLTFNTPFYPEILVASNVMAEGVDLHLNCRYVIHHDLCWNPSTLEQRTGRVDRLGAKAERCGKSISVYLPYISETQDEKMYRVVTDRERWFKVVMGEKFKIDAITAERMASRIMLPEEAAQGLAFKLEV